MSRKEEKVFLGTHTHKADYKFSESAQSVLAVRARPDDLELLMAHTTRQIKDVANGLGKILPSVDPQNYHQFKSLHSLYRAETHIDIVASSKMIAYPAIKGLDVNMYYSFNADRMIYEYVHAKIANPYAAEVLAPSELDVTDNIRNLIDEFSVSTVRTAPHYINYALLESNGAALAPVGKNPPSSICITATMTVPALELMQSELELDQIVRGWLNAPKEMIKAGHPHVHIVAHDIRATKGFLKPDYNMPNGIDSCVSFFSLSKRLLMDVLSRAGFYTSISFTADPGIVKGTVLGASHLCIDSYIIPALESIKLTNTRLRALKTEKAKANFIESTKRRAEDGNNVLNYLRSFPYLVHGLYVEPNYLLIKRRVANQLGTDTKLYIDPSIVNKLYDNSLLELVSILDISVSDAIEVAQYTGYDGFKNPFNKKVVADIKRALGIELSLARLEDFKTYFVRVREVRQATNPSQLIMSREKLWNK